MIRSRNAGDMLAPGVKQRDTADCETPALSATSYDVDRRRATAPIRFASLIGMSFPLAAKAARLRRI
jgi:hypothetical protein